MSKVIKATIVAILGMFLTACVTPIVGGPPGQGPVVGADSALGKDLVSAAYNLDNAVIVGALTADDPAPACVHGILQQAGIEVPAGTVAPGSFTPKNDGLVSAGAIAYIKIQQLKAQGSQALKVPVSCKQLVGQIVVDGLTSPSKVLVPLK